MGILETFLQKFQKTCSNCAGSGIMACHCNAQDEIICPNCLGSGCVKKSVVVNTVSEGPCDNPSCQNGQVMCSLCKGSGQTGHGEQCPQCAGSGKTLCSVCQGLKRVTHNCQETWFKNEVCPICHGAQVIACPYCHGTKNRVCSACRGTGRVWAQGKIAASLVLMVLMAAMPLIFITILGFTLTGLLLYTACQYFPSKREEIEKNGDQTPTNQEK